MKFYFKIVFSVTSKAKKLHHKMKNIPNTLTTPLTIGIKEGGFRGL